MLAPRGHARLGRHDDALLAHEERGLVAMNREPLRAGGADDLVDVRRLHEAKAGDDAVEALGAVAHLGALRGGDVGPAGIGHDGQQDVLPVQDLVVFDVLHQGVRRPVRIAREEDRGALAAVQFVLLVERPRDADRGDEIIQRHAGRQPVAEEAAPVLPCHHHEEDDRASHEREPASVQDLQGVRGEERGLDRAEEQAGQPGP